MTKRNLTERFKEYPKGSILLFGTAVKNCNLIEKKNHNIILW